MKQRKLFCEINPFCYKLSVLKESFKGNLKDLLSNEKIAKHKTNNLFPDERRRVPFGTGTSISYKSLDYRFKNNTNQAVQILVWCEDGELKGELRAKTEFPKRYELVETDHHFEALGDDYYRNSKVWRKVFDRETNKLLDEELILDNHSLVMYDHSLIPQEQIKNRKDAVTPLQ